MFVSIISSDLGSDLSPVKKGCFFNNIIYDNICIYIYKKPIPIYISPSLSLSAGYSSPPKEAGTIL